MWVCVVSSILCEFSIENSDRGVRNHENDTWIHCIKEINYVLNSIQWKGIEVNINEGKMLQNKREGQKKMDEISPVKSRASNGNSIDGRKKPLEKSLLWNTFILLKYYKITLSISNAMPVRRNEGEWKKGENYDLFSINMVLITFSSCWRGAENGKKKVFFSFVQRRCLLRVFFCE